MELATARKRFARRAVLLKKAWIIAAEMLGKSTRGVDGVVPDYDDWSRRDLETQISDLEDDISEALFPYLGEKVDVTRYECVKWLAERFDRWDDAGRGVFTISTLQDFERSIAVLSAVHEVMDVPPYAELLLQPGGPVVFRHPEYMLARDLEFLYGTYLDAEDVVSTVYDWWRASENARAGSENVQTLARSTILACFNLLESFVSGLGRAHVMRHVDLDDRTKRGLLNTQEPLRKRILSIPRAIAGPAFSLNINKAPFADLFGPIKYHRDAFVHCEPGPQQSDRGVIKEALFHGVSSTLVKHAVVLTIQSIRQIWNSTNPRPGPTWLHDLDESGRFPRTNLRLDIKMI